MAATAQFVLDRFLSVEVRGMEFLEPPAALDAYQKATDAAQLEGIGLLGGLQALHRNACEERSLHLGIWVESKRKEAMQVGLPEVRGHRLRQLEWEETTRRAALTNQIRLRPEIRLLVLFGVNLP